MTENSLIEGLMKAEETGQFRDPETGALIIMEGDKVFVYHDGNVFEADRISGMAAFRPVDGTADGERLNSAVSDAEAEEILTQKTKNKGIFQTLPLSADRPDAKKLKEQRDADLQKKIEKFNLAREALEKKNLEVFKDKLAKGDIFETQNPTRLQEMYRYVVNEVFGGGKDWNAQMQGGNAGSENGKGYKDAMTDRFRALYIKLKTADSAYLENGVLTEAGKDKILKEIDENKEAINLQFKNNHLLNQTGVGNYWGSIVVNTIAEGLGNWGSSVISANNAEYYARIRKEKLDAEIDLLIRQGKTPENFIKNFSLQETLTDSFREPIRAELTRRAEKLPLERFEMQYIYEKYILELHKKAIEDIQIQDIPKKWKPVNS